MFGLRVFHSLRARLIASYAFIIFLSLFLSGSTFIYLLRNYQTELRLNQLADLVVPMTSQVWTLDRQGASVAQIGDLLQEQATELKVRILLIDTQQKVVVDTASHLQNEELRLPGAQDVRYQRGVFSAVVRRDDGQEMRLLWLPARARPRLPAVERFIGRPPQHSLVLAIQPEDLTTAWLELAPHLAGAGLISLVISIVVALFISRSITGPISQMTRATEQMARGNYDQRIRATGNDEVGRLAATFNSMARDVGSSHRMLRDFVANVSHDLRTPLTSIQGFSQAMVDGAIQSSQEYARAGEIINDEAARMLHLVEDLLYLSRIESGQTIMEHQRLELGEMLRSCARRFAWAAEQNRVRLDVEVPHATQVEGDVHYLEQVFANLLDNALRHTPAEGSIAVRAWMDQPPEGDGWTPRIAWADIGRAACVAVHNTGSTIPPGDLQRIFERFHQVDRSRSRSANGSGLGLAIVREIVQAHGGAVAVRSRPGDGTEFLVVLPVRQPGGMRRGAPDTS